MGKTETPEQIFDEIDKVSIADVERVAKKIFVPEGLNLAIIGPYSSQAKFEKIIEK